MSRQRSRPDCDACEDIHEAKGTVPPCGTCTPPLMPENEEVVQVYNQIKNQVILAPMGGIIDINMNAVEIAVNRLNSPDPDTLYWSVVNLARHFIFEDQKKQQG